MKKFTVLVGMLMLLSANANAAVLCQSMHDPSFQAWFPGYACPGGYFLIRVK